MQQYLELLKDIKGKGTLKPAARAGMPGTLSLFGAELKFDLTQGFPLVTTKKVSFRNIITETLWFLKGDTNIKYLLDNQCNIWSEDAYNFYLKKVGPIVWNTKLKVTELIGKELKYRLLTFEEFIQAVKDDRGGDLYDVNVDYELGSVGKMYGYLWRNWDGKYLDLRLSKSLKKNGVDQIENLIKGLKDNPESRRHIVTSWNPSTLNDMALNTCHIGFQMNCRPLSIEDRWDVMQRTEWIESVMNTQNSTDDDELNHLCDEHLIPKYYLDCRFTLRSSDSFLGLPYNIASYALLTYIIAKMCNMIPGSLVAQLSDVHIYEDHLQQVEEQLTRTPMKLPELSFNDDFYLNIENTPDDIPLILECLQPEMFVLEGYQSHPAIRGKLSTGLH